MENNLRLSNTHFIKKENTDVIKGIAIVLMFFHHFFTMPPMWIDSVLVGYSDLHLEFFENPTKICVPIFAFLTGYFFYYSKHKSYRYSIRKITDVWLNYLFVMVILMLLSFALGVFNYSALEVVLEAFAITRKTMVFCWYVIFYVGAMLLLPLLGRVSLKTNFLFLVSAVVIPRAFVLLLKGYSDLRLDSIIDFFQFFYYLPCVFVGYIISRTNILGWASDKSDGYREHHKVLYIIICLVCVILPFLLRRYIIFVDFLMVPVFIFGLVSLIKLVKHRIILKPLSILGKYSLLMWFLHCAFFNTCREYTQPVLYFPHNPVLVLIWGLIICLLIAFVIKKPIDYIIKIKNRKI